MQTLEQFLSTMAQGTEVVVSDNNCNICYDGELDKDNEWLQKLMKYNVSTTEQYDGEPIEIFLDSAVPLKEVHPDFRGEEF